MTIEMTDNEFDTVLEMYDSDKMLAFLGQHCHSVKMKNGISYLIENLDDLKAVVEQELYTKLTGRE